MVNSGEDLFGEEFAASVVAPSRPRWSVAMLRWLGGSRLRNRRPNLSWSAHAAVARLPHPLQRRMLAKAEKHGWNSTQLRLEVRELVPKAES